KSLRRQMKHSQWSASQGMQGRFLSNPIGARRVRFRFLPSIDEMVRFETLIVSGRQLFDVILIALFNDSRQTLIRCVGWHQDRGPEGEEMQAGGIEICRCPTAKPSIHLFVSSVQEQHDGNA